MSSLTFRRNGITQTFTFPNQTIRDEVAPKIALIAGLALNPSQPGGQPPVDGVFTS